MTIQQQKQVLHKRSWEKEKKKTILFKWIVSSYLVTQVLVERLVYGYDILKEFILRGPIPTIGIDYGIKYTTINNRQYKIMIWDTAGQDRFLSHTRTMFRKKQFFI